MMQRLGLLVGLFLLWGGGCLLSAGVPFRSSYYDSRVNSLIVSVPEAEEYRPFPYYIPSQGERITFSFDLLEEVPRILRYRLEYYDADWSPSPLLTSEVQSGIPTGLVPYPEPSIATKVHYWHYSFTLSPSSDPTPKLSGNWRIVFFEEGNESTPLVEVSFGLVDPIFKLEVAASGNTQEGIYRSNQEVSATVRSSGTTAGYLEKGITLFVAQNGRSDNAQLLRKPSFVGLDYIEFAYQEAALFEGGNEYFSFEILGDTESNMGVKQLDTKVTPSYAVLFPHKNSSKQRYQTSADADGRQVIRAPYGSANGATEADYYEVEFTFLSPYIGSSLFLSGAAFDPLPCSERKMSYDADRGAYDGVWLLKAGYYSYQYLWGDSSCTTPLRSAPTVGSHYQTSNSYTVVAYFRGMNERNDKMVAVKELRIP